MESFSIHVQLSVQRSDPCRQRCVHDCTGRMRSGRGGTVAADDDIAANYYRMSLVSTNFNPNYGIADRAEKNYDFLKKNYDFI